MLTPVYTRQMEKDVKRMKKRGKPLDKLKKLIITITNEEIIDPIYKDHKLLGNWERRRECHIESDWLLIYKLDGNRVIFERTGTHSDLFS